jgi:hypothetical protein
MCAASAKWRVSRHQRAREESWYRMPKRSKIGP